jgi:uncharacterized coiled-coil protein SlyX
MANEFLAGLLESGVLTEEAGAQITEAWEAKLVEAREEITSELREEYAQKYEHDKTAIVETMDKMLDGTIRGELAEFMEDRKALISERVAYRKSIKEHAKFLEGFINQQLVKEIKELRDDRAKMNESLETTKTFVVKQLSRELAEFHEDKRELVETKVRMVAEGKELLNKTRKDFIRRSAGLVESTINTALTSELTALKEDIQEAKQNDFGRRIFEAFTGEFMASHLNEGTQVARMNSKLNEAAKVISRLENIVTEKENVITESHKKERALTERMNRNQVLEGLLAPLSKSKREVMTDLLESVHTTKLKTAFKKYLPAVLNENVKEKTSDTNILTEGKVTEHTGDRNVKASVLVESQSNDADIIQLKKLAGLN